jgi:hypothetical protein
MESNYHCFVNAVNNRDIEEANNSVVRELGDILVQDKESFVDLLNESGIEADIDTDEVSLVDLWVENIDKSKDLALGSSLLANDRYKVSSFEGGVEYDNEGVKAAYATLRKWYKENDVEEYSYLDPVTAIATAVGESAKLGSTISQGQQKKKYGTLDAATKKQEARSEMLKSFMERKNEEARAFTEKLKSDKKTQRTALIIGGVIVGAIVIGLVIKKIRSKK